MNHREGKGSPLAASTVRASAASRFSRKLEIIHIKTAACRKILELEKHKKAPLASRTAIIARFTNEVPAARHRSLSKTAACLAA